MIAATSVVTFGSCSGDEIESPDLNGNGSQYSGINDDAVCLLLNVSLGTSDSGTRADGDFVNGSNREHFIDFDSDGEAIAFFFDNSGNFMYYRQLFVNQLKGAATVPNPGTSLSEYHVPVIAYVPKDNLPSKVLVLLNGGPIFNKIKSDLDNGSSTYSKTTGFLDLKWENTLAKHGVIGKNEEEFFTMTNSSYYEGGVLKTVVDLNQNFYLPNNSNMATGEDAATIYVERMMAKFSTPTFETDVIGSDRVFRPDQNAMSIVVYSWDGEDLHSTKKNWRIHLLGWTINGRETENYVYKHLPQNNTDLADWNFSSWNDAYKKRSYWSIDPHYDDDANFYPWQYRPAIDMNDYISLVAGQTQNNLNPVLRYFSFDDVNYWDENALTISENTFDPTKYKANDPTVLDGRASMLAGPHLLITAELYLETGVDADYLGQFGTVSDIYSDRLHRFYMSEVDWFKMFVRDFNRSLNAQEIMTFPYYNWKKNLEDRDKEVKKYTMKPSGKCQLCLNRPELGYENVPLTNQIIDDLVDKGVTLSVEATVKDGDGRLLPWIDGIVIRDPEGGMLPIYDENNQKVSDVDNSDVRTNIRKSLFLEWFGPIDHYSNGYMYYAGAITHRLNENGTSFYGAVRNHWYKFVIHSINSLGTPVSDVSQPIIPGNFNYRDQISVYLELIDWHSTDVTVSLN